MQIYAENGQEALDSTLIAYRVSEDKEILIPAYGMYRWVYTDTHS